MKFELNAFGLNVQLYVTSPRLYVIYLNPVDDMLGDFPVVYASTRLSAYYKAWSLARFWARYDRKSYIYSIYRVDFNGQLDDGSLIRSRVIHQETRSRVSFFSSKPLSR